MAKTQQPGETPLNDRRRRYISSQLSGPSFSLQPEFPKTNTSLLQPRPQTPPKKRHQTTSVAATPTPRTGSRGSLPFSELTEEVTPRAHPTQAPDSHSQSSGFLLDFTTQFNAASHPQNQDPTTPSHRRTRSASPNKQASPAKFPLPPSTPAESRFFNLLDFSPGPLATPRSIPSITPREVESLKASYQSQISQLKAELSGREVEITGLRDAVRESEDRSAAMAHTMKQQEVRLEEERDNWRNVRNELGELFEAEKAEKATLRAEFEKRESELTEQTEDAVRELEEARQRANVAEEEAARAQKEAEKAKETAASRPSTPSSATAPTSPGSSANVQAEVEKVARELHSLYKAKHESKVAALKKSYESRWEKKIGQLQAELEAEKRRNEELQSQIVEKGAEDLTGDIGFSPARPASSSSPASEELKEELTRLKQELSIVQSELETERREKGELVGAVEELLAIQAGPGGGQAQVETEKVKKRVARVSGVGLPSGMTGGGFQGGLKSGIARMGGGVRDKN